ncbi:hypothetical protein EDB80DRAFT_125034 [Ilyonectria destructans]|nr:hypothetical protein EDB80DRAFT_125034 [Ilyonectria destructans]
MSHASPPPSRNNNHKRRHRTAAHTYMPRTEPRCSRYSSCCCPSDTPLIKSSQYHTLQFDSTRWDPSSLAPRFSPWTLLQRREWESRSPHASVEALMCRLPQPAISSVYESHQLMHSGLSGRGTWVRTCCRVRTRRSDPGSLQRPRLHPYPHIPWLHLAMRKPQPPRTVYTVRTWGILTVKAHPQPPLQNSLSALYRQFLVPSLSKRRSSRSTNVTISCTHPSSRRFSALRHAISS